MPLIPLRLKPGLYRNGTAYSQKNRYVDGNLVRYHDGAYRPIGGWLRRQNGTNQDIASLIDTPADEAIRDIFAWKDVTQTNNVVFGSNLALYHMDASGDITDITYSGYSPINSSKEPDDEAGYGENPYGVGAYGVGEDLLGRQASPPDRWYFGAFGEVLLTGVVANEGIYELDLSSLSLSKVTNAPEDNQDMCITDQRQVFVVGAGGNPRQVQVSEIEDYSVWSPTRTNQAVNRTLAGTGKLLRCIPVRKQVLILGEVEAHAAKYINLPYVYSIELVGRNCGPLAAQAVTATENFAVWWGARNFWLYDGTIRELPCDVIDFLYEDIDLAKATKISAYTNRKFSEVTWLYQSYSSTTTEVDSYVTWNYKLNIWMTGRIDRTAGIDSGVLNGPIMVNSSGEIFNHELDNVIPLNEGNIFIETGPLELGVGETNMALRYIYPDFNDLNGVQFTIYGRQFPTEQEYAYGPYDAANPTPVRAMGRALRLRVDFSDDASELGNLRFDIAGTGTGKR